MKDIAAEAGVSIATVSYILNNAPGQTISADTRQKVLEASERLQYSMNLAAQSLKSGKSGLVGILLPKVEPAWYWSAYKYAKAVALLEKQLMQQGYHVILSYYDLDHPAFDLVLERKLDGVIVFDVTEDIFTRISSHYGMGIPVVLMESYVADPLFHKVVPDFKAAMQQLQPDSGQQQASFLVMDAYHNAGMCAQIRRDAGLTAEHTHIYHSDEGLEQFLGDYRGKYGLVVNEFLASRVLQQHANVGVICTCGCPDLLPGSVRKAVFPESIYSKVTELLLGYMQSSEYRCEEEYIYR